ncbi:MAG TPA: LamG domain-containing protein, partial [archaeon]|nr:LamG domain-containing protein [archaeon]
MSQDLSKDIQNGLLVYWNFDKIIDKNYVLDSVSNKKDQIIGYVDLLDGIKGNALRLDGYTTHLAIPNNRLPKSLKEFTISAWIANGAYTWNEGPIIENYNEKHGFFLGVTANGRIRFKVIINGEAFKVESEEKTPLFKWMNVTSVFDSVNGVFLYINGELKSAMDIKEDIGKVSLPNDSINIGRAAMDAKPTNGVNNGGHFACPIYVDGLIDELKFFNKALSIDQIKEIFTSIKGIGEPPLEKRGLPSLPNGPNRFGAYYTTLKYYKEWDRLWRVRDHADVVVLFDDKPIKYVFWRGLNYISAWVTGNGIWYTNEFNETWADNFDPDINGCAEPMSDKQCKTSQVRIIESNDARVIVHWRYALIDTRYRQARVDPLSQWGDWSDEYYVIYPDGVGIRDITLHSSQPMEPHEFQESIVIIGEGMCPEDVYDLEAVTFFNMKGESYTYSWEIASPKFFLGPKNKNIEIINIKSETVPFFIVQDGPCIVASKEFNGKKRRNPHFMPYAYFVKSGSHFPWWNSWPVANIPTDGRFTSVSDRPAHTNVSSGAEWADYEVGPELRRRIMLHGVWDKNNKEKLVILAKSWLRAPEIELKTDAYEGGKYVPHERAYYFT